MDLFKEVFIATDLVGIDSGLHNISVFEDWQATYDSEPLGLTPTDALCLSALISLQDKLTTTFDRDEKILELHAEAKERGMDKTGFYENDSLQYHDRLRRSAEYTILRKTSRLYPYLYSLGAIGAKRLLLCSNVQVIDGGLRAIENLFPDADDTEQKDKLLKEFLREYRRRESSDKTEQENDDAIADFKIINKVSQQKPAKTVEKTNKLQTQLTTKQPRPKKLKKPIDENLTPVIDTQEQKDYIAEIRGNYSPISEYLNIAKIYIYDTPIGENFSKKEIVKFLEDQGHTPNPADVDVLLLEFSRGGIIKKTNETQQNNNGELVFVRFNIE